MASVNEVAVAVMMQEVLARVRVANLTSIMNK